MGNNHEKYFSKEKRKLLILGLEGTGKSSILYISTSPCKDSKLK